MSIKDFHIGGNPLNQKYTKNELTIKRFTTRIFCIQFD